MMKLGQRDSPSHQSFAQVNSVAVIQEFEQQEGIYFKYKSRKQSGEKFMKKLIVGTIAINQGNQTFLLTTIRDMSFWLDYVRQISVSKVKSIAFASAAHEFRNPLNAIAASIELLEPLIDLQRGYKLYTTVRNCSSLMLYLVNDILDFS